MWSGLQKSSFSEVAHREEYHGENGIGVLPNDRQVINQRFKLVILSFKTSSHFKLEKKKLVCFAGWYLAREQISHTFKRPLF